MIEIHTAKRKFSHRLFVATKAVLTVALITGGHVAPVYAAEAVFDGLGKFNESVWEKSGPWANSAMFNVIWKPEAITHTEESTGAMSLTLSKCTAKCVHSGENWPYVSGEYTSRARNYGYGLYEVRMKAAKGSGLVSSFFTYVPGPNLDYARQDEIDIEILGRTDEFDDKDGGSCNKKMMLQINYFRLGSKGNEIRIPLNFDASEKFHTYAFEWRPNYIKWFVDGKLRYTYTQNEDGTVTGAAPKGWWFRRHVVYDASEPDYDNPKRCRVSVTKTGSSELPKKPGKLMMNLWAGRSTPPNDWTYKWIGDFAYETPVSAEYDWVRYTP